MLEAMACGTPVAAFPVTGPIDLVQQSVNGWPDEDLATAVDKALQVNRESCTAFARSQGWDVITRRFADNLAAVATGLPIEHQPSADGVQLEEAAG